MPVLSRTRAAAVCAGLSTAAVVGMAAVAVLAGDRACDLSGCAPPVAAFAVSTAVHATAVEPTCTTPSTTPSTAPGSATTRLQAAPCDTAGAGAGAGGPVPTGGIATARVPAP
jgi:hypothetical protein